jgi:hypothetical protein
MDFKHNLAIDYYVLQIKMAPWEEDTIMHCIMENVGLGYFLVKKYILIIFFSLSIMHNISSDT